MNNEFTFLLVDDNHNNLFALGELITSTFDCRPLTASSGEEALRLLNRQDVDIILMDVRMPGMDGFETANILKSRKKTANIPIIFITAHDPAKTLMEKGFDSGGIDYVTKPIDDHELIYRIKIYLRFIQLERSINKMLEEKVVERTRQLNEKNLQLQEEINKREQLESERQEIQSKAFAQSKLASLGMLSAGVAHEINNPNTFISGNIQTIETFWPIIQARLQQNLDNQPDKSKRQFILKEMPKRVAGIKKGVTRIASIVNGLKSFARKDDPQIEPVDINSAIANALELCHNTLKYHIKIESNLQNPLPPVLGDQRQLEQVFINLFINAAQAIGDKDGKLEINTRIAGKNVVATVRDNGPGIPEEVLNRVWDPFFTTKKVGEGTGLGLSVTLGIVQNHRGAVKVENHPKGGAIFTITLPGK